jgi:hypothetical protein
MLASALAAISIALLPVAPAGPTGSVVTVQGWYRIGPEASINMAEARTPVSFFVPRGRFVEVFFAGSSCSVNGQTLASTPLSSVRCVA